MSVIAVRPPFAYFTDTAGLALDAGYVYVGVENLDPIANPITCYWDEALTIPAPIPIRTTGGYLSRNGAAGVLYTSGLFSILVKDKNGRLVYSASTIDQDASLRADLASTASTALGDALVGVKSALTGGTPRTQHDKNADVIDANDFGVVGDGTADDTAALQAAVTAAAGRTLHIPGGTYKISSAIAVPNNTTIHGDGAATIIKLATGDISGFTTSTATRVVIRDLAITCSVVGTTAYTAGIKLSASNGCTVDNVEMTGLSWAGVMLNQTNVSIVKNCRFSAWAATTIQNNGDIIIYSQSSNNKIMNNYCMSGGYQGIMVQDPYDLSTPTGNLITGNTISGQIGYGILLYVTTSYNTKTVVTDNIISNISGSALSGQSGNGIYVQSMCGAIVKGNTISGCCTSTTAFDTQVVGSIGVALNGAFATASCAGNVLTVTAITGSMQVGFLITGAGYPASTYVTAQLTGSVGSTGTYSLSTTPGTVGSGAVVGSPVYGCEVVNNTIACDLGPGIFVGISNAPVIVDGNTIFQSSGAATARSESIRLVACQRASIVNNAITHNNSTYAAIGIAAPGIQMEGLNISGNIITTWGSGIGANVVTTGTFKNVVLSNNLITGCTSPAISFEKTTSLLLTGNNCESTGPVFSITNCPKTRASSNRFYSPSGSANIILTGAAAGNSGTVIDESNDLDGRTSNDAGTGGIIIKYDSGAPGGLTWAVGDRVIQSVPVVGQPKGWRCTVAGVPGTWVSEGNL